MGRGQVDPRSGGGRDGLGLGGLDGPAVIEADPGEAVLEARDGALLALAVGDDVVAQRMTLTRSPTETVGVAGGASGRLLTMSGL